MSTKTVRKTAQPAGIAESSGNVFADLGLPNAEQEFVKAQLTLQIHRIIAKRGLTQGQAAKLLGIKTAAHLVAHAQPRGDVFRGAPDVDL